MVPGEHWLYLRDVDYLRGLWAQQEAICKAINGFLVLRGGIINAELHGGK